MTIEEIQVPNDDDARRTSPLETIRREIFDADPEVELAAFITGAKDRGFELLSATAVQFTPGTRGYVALYRVLAVVLALLVAAPVFAQTPGCTIATGHKGSDAIVTRTTRWYECTTATGAHVPVSKAWFKVHQTRTFDGGAGVNAFAEPAKPGDKLASPTGFWHKVKVGAEVTLITTIVIIVIAGGGGGAFTG